MSDEKNEEVFDESNQEDEKSISRIIRLLSSSFIPLIASIVSALILSRLIFYSGDTFNFNKKVTESDQLNNYLLNGVKIGVFSEEYFNIAFNHFDRKSDGKLHNYGRIETLEDFIIFINSSNDNSKDINTEEVTTLLENFKKTEPFSALPIEEKRLMDQLQILISLPTSKEQVSNVLDQLKQVILARHKEYQRIENQNTWSIPLSFIGILLTLVFGVWTTVLSIRQSRSRYYKRLESIKYLKDKNGKIRNIVTY